MKKATIKRLNMNFNSIPNGLENDLSRLFTNIMPKCNLSKSIDVKDNQIKFNNYTYRVGNYSKDKKYKIFKDITIDTEYFKVDEVGMNIGFHNEYVYSGCKIVNKEYIKVEFTGLSQRMKNQNFKYIVTPIREIKKNNGEYLVYPKFLFELNDKNKKEIKHFIKNVSKFNKYKK